MEESICALEQRRDEILELKERNIAELEVDEALASFNLDPASCDPFLVDSLLASEGTTGGSSPASPGSGGS